MEAWFWLSLLAALTWAAGDLFDNFPVTKAIRSPAMYLFFVFLTGVPFGLAAAACGGVLLVL